MVTQAEINTLKNNVGGSTKRRNSQRRVDRYNNIINAIGEISFLPDGTTRPNHRYKHRVMSSAEQQAIYNDALTEYNSLEE